MEINCTCMCFTNPPPRKCFKKFNYNNIKNDEYQKKHHDTQLKDSRMKDIM